jgi:hypothetical protein
LRNSGDRHDERQAFCVSFWLFSTTTLALAIGGRFLAFDSLRAVHVVGIECLVLFL